MSGIIQPTQEYLLKILRSLPRPDITNMFGESSAHAERMSGGYVVMSRSWIPDLSDEEVFLVNIQGLPETRRVVLTALEEILGQGTEDDLKARAENEGLGDYYRESEELTTQEARIRGLPLLPMSWHYWPATRLDEYDKNHRS